MTVPPGNPTNPMPVGADLARLIDLRQGDGLTVHAGSRLPPQGRAGWGHDIAPIQKAATSVRPKRAQIVSCFILCFLSWFRSLCRKPVRKDASLTPEREGVVCITL